MGLYSVSFSIDTGDASLVVDHHRRELPDASAFISPAVNHWVTVYSNVDLFRTGSFARLAGLSRACAAGGLAFSVLASDALTVQCFDVNGQSVAALSVNALGAVHAVSNTVPSALRAIAALFARSVTEMALEAVLRRPQLFANNRLKELGDLFGLVHLGFSYDILKREIGQMTDQELPDVRRFTRIEPSRKQ
jgi:hypothetical protein